MSIYVCFSIFLFALFVKQFKWIVCLCLYENNSAVLILQILNLMVWPKKLFHFLNNLEFIQAFPILFPCRFFPSFYIFFFTFPNFSLFFIFLCEGANPPKKICTVCSNNLFSIVGLIPPNVLVDNIPICLKRTRGRRAILPDPIPTNKPNPDPNLQKGRIRNLTDEKTPDQEANYIWINQIHIWILPYRKTRIWILNFLTP